MSVAEQSVADLLAAIAARTPTPGGGAVAACTAGLAAARGLMVVNYSAGRRDLAEHDHLHRQAQPALERTRAGAVALAEADAAAYAALHELWRLDATDPRRTALPRAARAAIDVPQRVLGGAVDTLQWLQRLAGRTNRRLDSDLAVAAILAETAARAAAWNVRINLPLLGEESEATRIEGEIARTLERARELAAAVERGCGEGA